VSRLIDRSLESGDVNDVKLLQNVEIRMMVTEHGIRKAASGALV
jgi:hypothetical protein